MSTDNLTPAGRYPGILRSVQFAEASTGNTQAVLGFEFLNEANEPSNLFMSYFGGLTDNSIDFTVEALRNCGWEGDDLSELPAMAEAGAFGTVVQLVVVHETYKDKTSAKIKFVNRSGGGKLRLERALDDASLKDFAARMKSKVRAAGRDGGQRRPSGNGQARQPAGGYAGHDVPPPGDGDIPFATANICAEPSPIARCIRRGV